MDTKTETTDRQKSPFAEMTRRLSRDAHVGRVYGDPIVVGEKTVIPVARVAYGFGGGGGDGPDETTGWGGGGGVAARPLGVVEVTGDRTRFVRYGGAPRLVAAALGGALVALVGTALRRRLTRRETRRQRLTREARERGERIARTETDLAKKGAARARKEAARVRREAENRGVEARVKDIRARLTGEEHVEEAPPASRLARLLRN